MTKNSPQWQKTAKPTVNSRGVSFFHLSETGYQLKQWSINMAKFISSIGQISGKLGGVVFKRRGNTLGNCATLDAIYKFTYDEIIDRAKTIDVIWFDNRKFPQSFFEVEHSTDFQNSFVKMLDLKSFYANFNIVADEKRYREYEKKISYSTFEELKNRIKFISYDKLSDYHSKSFEYFALNKELQI
jgi:hypothetical protein